MPVSPTYPGVYVEEIPSGVRTITGVATSITAFIGRAKRGPVNVATTINGMPDYERIFGGLDLNSSMSFAVKDFFLNGGGQAVIVRLFNAPEGTEGSNIGDTGDTGGAGGAGGAGEDNENGPPPETKTTTEFDLGGVKLQARYPGAWGSYLRAEIDKETSEEVAISLGLVKADLFNLTVRDTSTGGDTEKFLNVSFKESLRRIDKVLDAESKLVRWGEETYSEPEVTPEKASDPVTIAEKAVTEAMQALLTAQDSATSSNGENSETSTEETALENAKKALQDAKETLKATDGLSLLPKSCK